MKRLTSILFLCVACCTVDAADVVLGVGGPVAWNGSGTDWVASWASGGVTYWTDTNSPVLRYQGTYYADGLNLFDSSGNAYHATNVAGGAIRTNLFSGTAYPHKDGTTNWGYRFDGVDDYFRYAAANAVSTSTSGTVAFVINHRVNDDEAAFGTADEQSSVDFFVLRRAATQKMLLAFRSVELGVHSVQTDATFATNVPWAVAWTSDGDLWRCYVNGILRPVSPVLAAYTNLGYWFGDLNDRDSVTVGARRRTVVDDQFTGDIDDVRVYNRPLASNEVWDMHGTFNSWTNEQVIAP